MSAAAPANTLFNPRLGLRRGLGRVFTAFCLLLSLTALVALGALLWQVIREGWSLLSWQFLTEFPSQLDPLSSGIKSAIFGTLWVIGLTALIAVPVGVGAAVYLQEYARNNWLNRFINLNIANLAGVPSIVYGLLGLAVFVRGFGSQTFGLGRSPLAGALTMSLLVLPVIIIASREALAAVPDSIRQAAYALGATRWQTIRHHVLPAALPGMMTGVILSLSRAIGEAAPLIVIGAVVYVAFVPDGPLGDQYTVLPLQIYSWVEEPHPEFHQLAAAAILVLLGILLSMNAVAVAIRAWQQRNRL